MVFHHVTTTPPSTLYAVWANIHSPIFTSLLQNLNRVLSAHEIQRMQRFVYKADQYRYACAHILLRYVLAHATQTQAHLFQFEYNEHEKPLIAWPESLKKWHFNLSHAHDLVACIVSENALVGIDVEFIQRKTDIHKMAARFFDASEVAQLEQSQNQTHAFFHFFTLKEALLKAWGVGLSGGLEHCVLQLEPTVQALKMPQACADLGPWFFHTQMLEQDYVLSMACATPIEPTWHITCFDAEFLRQ